jgi:hypothetical protein
MDMDAIWGLTGVVVGGLLAVGGKILLQAEESFAAIRNERKCAYLALLTAARQLRYFAHSVDSLSHEDLDNLRTQLSIANYEIELLATPTIAAAADKLRRRTLDYLKLAKESKQPESEDSSQDYEARRQAARDASEAFIKMTRIDLQRKWLSSDSNSGVNRFKYRSRKGAASRAGSSIR